MRSTQSSTDNVSLIQRYLDHLRVERRYSQHTVAAAQRDLALIDMPIENVTSTNLKMILAKRHGAGLSPASLARMASNWRGFFKFLVIHAAIESDPTLGLKSPKRAKTLPKAVGVDSLAALLQGPLPQDFRFAQAHTLIELLYCTGLRVSEALALDAAAANAASELTVTGKGAKTRVVPIIDVLKQRLTEFAQLRDIHLHEKGCSGQPALFVTAKGARLSARQAQRDVADYAALKGLGQHLHPHMLRHSFGSHLLQGTQNLRAVQELLGHSSIASTQIYTALDFEHLSSVYDKAFPRAR